MGFLFPFLTTLYFWDETVQEKNAATGASTVPFRAGAGET